MPLMIDAITLVPCLQRLEVTRTAALSAMELMVTTEDDAFDEYAALAEQANGAHTEALAELARRVRALVDEADQLPA
jgi:hypothetical protein